MFEYKQQQEHIQRPTCSHFPTFNAKITEYTSLKQEWCDGGQTSPHLIQWQNYAGKRMEINIERKSRRRLHWWLWAKKKREYEEKRNDIVKNMQCVKQVVKCGQRTESRCYSNVVLKGISQRQKKSPRVPCYRNSKERYCVLHILFWWLWPSLSFICWVFRILRTENVNIPVQYVHYIYYIYYCFVFVYIFEKMWLVAVVKEQIDLIEIRIQIVLNWNGWRKWSFFYIFVL